MEEDFAGSRSVGLSAPAWSCLSNYISEDRDIDFMLVGRWTEAHWLIMTASHRAHPRLLSPLLLYNSLAVYGHNDYPQYIPT